MVSGLSADSSLDPTFPTSGVCLGFDGPTVNIAERPVPDLEPAVRSTRFFAADMFLPGRNRSCTAQVWPCGPVSEQSKKDRAPGPGLLNLAPQNGDGVPEWEILCGLI